MSAVAIQEVIDEYKQQLPDELYRQLCSLTMIQNKNEENQEQIYKITYVKPIHYYDDDCKNNNIYVKIKTQLIQLEKKIYDKIVENINDCGSSPSKIYIGQDDDGCIFSDILNVNKKQTYNSNSTCYDDNKIFSWISHPLILSIVKV